MSESLQTEARPVLEDELVALLPDLLGSALRLTHDRVEAEELVAEAVATALAKLPTLRDPGALRGWVLRIQTNVFLSGRRSAAVRAEEPLPDACEEDFSLFERLHQPFLLWWGNPEREFLDRLLRQELERAIDALPDPFRVVVVLADVEGLSYREIAETLDVPVGTVRSRLSRGRACLQKALWTHGVDAGLAGPREERGAE